MILIICERDITIPTDEDVAKLINISKPIQNYIAPRVLFKRQENLFKCCSIPVTGRLTHEKENIFEVHPRTVVICDNKTL